MALSVCLFARALILFRGSSLPPFPFLAREKMFALGREEGGRKKGKQSETSFKMFSIFFEAPGRPAAFASLAHSPTLRFVLLSSLGASRRVASRRDGLCVPYVAPLTLLPHSDGIQTEFILPSAPISFSSSSFSLSIQIAVRIFHPKGKRGGGRGEEEQGEMWRDLQERI